MKILHHCVIHTGGISVLLHLLLLPNAFADWNVDDPAKWSQLPDETPLGVDVRLYAEGYGPPPGLWLADDFLCEQTGPITDIHFWGSWLGDLHPTDPQAIQFHLSIWSDVPTNEVNEYSHPGILLWETNVSAPDFIERIWTNVPEKEGWYDPVEGQYNPAADELIWQYNFFFDRESAFIQQGTPENPVVYWLAINVMILDPEFMGGFGWKTSMEHWNDDAVWAIDPGQWMELRYPLGHPMEGVSMDLSFVITTETESLDFGDAPDQPYPTLLANDGARHVISPGIFMGTLIDAESDGQPDPQALGDDTATLADEDGITFTSGWVVGQPMTFDAVCSTSGFLSAWMDFNRNGSWADGGETVLFMTPVGPGTNALGFMIPGTAGTGTNFVRFRFTTQPVTISYTGLVSDGEVEDYLVVVQDESVPTDDFGDAPDSIQTPGYPTLLAHNGARHGVTPGVYLGNSIDSETDGQPSNNSDGDDLAGLDDEDGVSLPAILTAGMVTSVQVVASVPGFLNAWIDWNNNGTWIDPGEQVFINQPLAPGINVLPLTVPLPPMINAGGPHSRWRFTTYAPTVPQFTGLESDGEVEDYEVHLEVLDFGDAPDPLYPTLLNNNGASHRIPSAYWLGLVAPDLEPDGQPDSQALGDDNNGSADEDGVVFNGSLVRGVSTLLGVIASTNGFLNAWIDFNANGSWLDAGEQIVTDLLLSTGPNLVGVTAPQGAALGPTFARFRFSSLTGLSPTGMAANGEVEDYQVDILQPRPTMSLVITNLIRNGSTGVVFWTWESNVTYQLQTTTNLVVPVSPVWTNLGGLVDAPTSQQMDPGLTETVRFYRVIAPWTP